MMNIQGQMRCMGFYLPSVEILERMLVPYVLHKTVNWLKKSASFILVSENKRCVQCSACTEVKRSISDAQCVSSGCAGAQQLDACLSTKAEAKCKDVNIHHKLPNDLPPGLLRYAYAQYIMIQRWKKWCSDQQQQQLLEEHPQLEKPVHIGLEENMHEPQVRTAFEHVLATNPLVALRACEVCASSNLTSSTCPNCRSSSRFCKSLFSRWAKYFPWLHRKPGHVTTAASSGPSMDVCDVVRNLQDMEVLQEIPSLRADMLKDGFV
jgi:hypothetical protein